VSDACRRVTLEPVVGAQVPRYAENHFQAENVLRSGTPSMNLRTRGLQIDNGTLRNSSIPEYAVPIHYGSHNHIGGNPSKRIR
jgi:hypothetical protein